MHTVVIFPGSFQPMLKQQAQTYQKLQDEFPNATVYVATSDKVDRPNSPFNFSQKKRMILSHGIPDDRVLSVRRPYDIREYDFDPDSTIMVFAVPQQDQDKFPFSNVDKKTGLDMTVREPPKPRHVQKISTMGAQALPMAHRVYVAPIPDQRTAAATRSFRDAMVHAPDLVTAQKIFTDQFGQFDQSLFDMVYGVLRKNSGIQESLERLRKLAGLK